MKRAYFLNSAVDLLRMDEVVSCVEDAMKSDKKLHHVVVNAAKIVNMQGDDELRESVMTADIINADGISVVWAGRCLGFDVPERVTGIDLMENLMALAHKMSKKVYFLGATPEVLNQVIKFYQVKYSPSLIGGFHHGYFKAHEESEIVSKINASGSSILLVAMSSPRKEIFLKSYKNALMPNFVMGVGGSFDVVAGKVQRAPLLFQKLGLEWFYRLIQEPQRLFWRYFRTNFLFLYLVIKDYVSNIFSKKEGRIREH